MNDNELVSIICILLRPSNEDEGADRGRARKILALPTRLFFCISAAAVYSDATDVTRLQWRRRPTLLILTIPRFKIVNNSDDDDDMMRKCALTGKY